MRTELSTPDSWIADLHSYAQWMRAAGRPDTTIYLRGYHLRRFAIATGLAPDAIDTEHVLHHLAAHTWSAGTRRSVRSSLRSFFTWRHTSGRSAINPAEQAPPVPSPIGVPRPAPDDAVRFALTRADQRVRLMVELAASAGLRCCEIAVVHTDDVSQEADGWVLQVHGKGAKVRVIPVMTELATALLRGGRGYVFPGDIEGHLSSGYVSKLVSRSLPGGWTAHTLRHRFASTAYSVDSDLRAVQELLGHASIATTQIYVKVPDDAKRRAVVGAGAIAFGVAA